MLLWFENDKIKIELSQEPKTGQKQYLPYLTPEQIKEIDDKPYINEADIEIKITYKGRVNFFKIKEGYDWNGANVPVFAWYIVGSPDEPKLKFPSMVHDYLCEHHECARNDRYLSTLIFCSLLEVSKVNRLDRFLMFHAVDNFQKLYGKDLRGNKWK